MATLPILASELADGALTLGFRPEYEADKSIPVWIAVENCHLFTSDGTALQRDVEPPTWK